jgi:xylulokinase
VSRGAAGGWLLEGGLSAAGSLVDWLSRLTGLGPEALMGAAASSPVGARGVIALPWFGGARAPRWRPTARGGFVGLSFDHDAGDLARAVIEAVAREVLGCLGSMGAVPPDGAVPARSLWLTGAGPATGPWAEVLAAVTGLPAARRRSGQAASTGAALLAAAAVGAGYDLDRIDPVVETIVPDEAAVARYASLRRRTDEAAAVLVALDLPGAP